jgi:hypothetical protein
LLQNFWTVVIHKNQLKSKAFKQ